MSSRRIREPFLYVIRPRSEESGGATQGTRPFIEKDRPIAAPKPKLLDSAAIRAWANVHGHEVSPKGRIPDDVLSACN